MVESRGDRAAGADETAAAPWADTVSPSRADTLSSAGSPRRVIDVTEDELPADIRLGRFTLLRVLGRGGMGVVYTAYDELLDRIVAIKLVRSDQEDPDLLARVLREAKALAKLSHPNVVQIHDVSESDGQVFIAMEFVDGPTLRAWTEARREAGASARELLAVLVQAGRGLAAAHAAGLVHRDFKPDNVLVGADGRARVLDFGLVAGRVEPAPRRREVSVTSSDQLTREGAIVGTPAYMSPEQWMGRTADARSDQYSFCAAVYEALYGVRPFAGTTSVDVLAAISRAELQPGVHAPAIPAPVAAALRRGLSFKPEARFPDLDALLAELEDVRGEARRRRLRFALLVAVTAAVVVALVLLGQDLLERQGRERREAEAAAALVAVEARIAEARAAGDASAAARIFTSFLEEPVLKDTGVPARAWLGEAARRRADGDDAAAVSALARAFTLARDPDDGARALRGLAGLFRARLDWDGLAQVLTLLDRHHPEAADDPELAAIRGEVALALRDFERASALPGPRGRLARALLPARRSEFVHVRQVFGRVGDELWLLEHGPAGPVVHAAAADASLAPRWRHPLASGTTRAWLVDPHSGALVARGDELVLYTRGEGEGLQRAGSWPGVDLSAATAGDLDGDGRRELYVGTGTSREIVELVPDDHGGYTLRVVYSATDSLDSIANSLLATDLDGDGRDELVATFGEWRAYDVRVLRRDPAAGTLVTVARDKLGMSFSLGAVRGPGGEPLVVAEVLHREPNPLVFPAGTPHGAPAGTYLLALAGERLIRRVHVPFVLDGPGATAEGVHRQTLVGDVDGDGRREFVNRYLDRGAQHSVVQLQDEQGGFVPAVLDGVEILMLAQLDDDPADELLVNLDDDTDGQKMWALGVGDERLPIRDTHVLKAISERGLVADPALREAFAAADDLRALGLLADAAAAYEGLAGRAPAGAARSGALIDAAALREGLGDDAAALALYREAERGEHVDEALAGQFRALLRLGDHEQALQTIEALRRRPSLAPGQAADLLEQRDRLARAVEGHPPIDLTFTRALAEAWTIRDPLAVRRRPLAVAGEGGAPPGPERSADSPSPATVAPATAHVPLLQTARARERPPTGAPEADGALEIRTASAGPLAELLVEWDGETIDLSIDLTLEHTEWSTLLSVELVPEEATARPVVSLAVLTYGTSRGGQPPLRTYWCHVGERRLYLDRAPSLLPTSPAVRSHMRLRAFAVTPLGEFGCGLTELDRDESRVQRERLAGRLGPPGRYRLVIRLGNDVPAWLSVQVHRLALRGARLLEPPPAEPRRAALLLAAVEGDAVAALAALATLRREGRLDARERALQALLLVRAGRLAEAEPLWRALLHDSEARAPLLTLLRGHHAVVGPVLRAISEPRYLDLLAEAWRNTGVNHLDDPRVVPVLGDILSDLDPERLAPAQAGPVELARAADLLTWRGRLHARAGRPGAASDDLTRALALLGRAGQDRALPATMLRLDLASLAARHGETTGAREHLEAARAGSTMPLLVEDIVRARPELAALTPGLTAR